MNIIEDNVDQDNIENEDNGNEGNIEDDNSNEEPASKKTKIDVFSIFLKHFSKDFCLFLKDLSCTTRKKSILNKNKHLMKNPLVEKLDMVPYFTLLATFE